MRWHLAVFLAVAVSLGPKPGVGHRPVSKAADTNSLVAQRLPAGAGMEWDIAIDESGLQKIDLTPGFIGIRTANGMQEPPSVSFESSLNWLQQLNFVRRPVKFYVDARGIYRVTVSALLDSGFDWRGTPCSALHLFCQGKQVPIWVDDLNGDGYLQEEDALEFWGEPYRPQPEPERPDVFYNGYTRVNAYWLVESSAVPPRRLLTLPGNLTDLPAYQPRWFLWSEHFEKDKMFFRLGRVPYPVRRDHWFWGRIAGGHLETFRFQLPWPDTTTAMAVRIRACLHGRTYGDLGQHAVRLVLGNQDVGQVLEWRDQNLLITELEENATIYADVLRAGENTFSVLNLNPDEANEILFNWFEITYPRQYRAWEDELEFGVPNFVVGHRARFQLEGLSTDGVDVYKLGVGKFAGVRRELVKEETTRGIEQFWQIELEDRVESEAVRYVAVACDKKRVPRAMLGANLPVLRAPGADIDYVVVSPDSFLNTAAMDSLLSLRKRQGLQVWAVSTESIYDNFNWGIYSADAIWKFSRFLLGELAHPPRFLVLVGNALRARECFENPRVLVPAPIVQTVKYGAVSSDNQLAAASEVDVHPEMAVGRLPVANQAELSLMVRKLWRYADRSKGFWRNRILMIAGRDAIFKTQTQTILQNRWNRAFDLHRLDATPSKPPFLGSSSDLLAFWNRGAGLINFMGHGGGMVWADARMLTFDEIPQIANGDKLPFVTSMTCFTGAFEAGSRCLGNALLLHPEGGAIAVLGSAGLGWVWNDYYLLNELVRTLQDTSVHTVGEAVRVAKTRYYDRFATSLATTMLNQYTLLGDPATPILLPRETLKADATFGEEGRLTVKLPLKLSSGRAQLLWPDFLFPLAEFDIHGQTDSLNFVVPEPARSQPESLAVRFVGNVENGGFLLHGFVHPGLGHASIDSVWWDPPVPTEGDSVRFWLRTRGLASNAIGAISGSIPLQTVPFTTTGETGVWRSAGRLVFLAPGDYTLMCVFRSGEGALLAKKTVQFGVWPRQSVRLRWASLGLLDHAGETFAEAEVTNQKPVTAKVLVKFWVQNAGQQTWQACGVDTVLLEPFENTWARVPCLPCFGPVRLRGETLGRNGRQLDVAERNLNATYLHVVGGRYENLQARVDTVRVGGFVLRPMGRQAFLVQVRERSLQPELLTQKGVVAYSNTGIEIRQIGSARPRFAVRTVVAVASGAQLRLCEYDSAAGVWISLPSSGHGKDWSELDHSALIGLFQVSDSTGPSIRVLSEGRPVAPGAAVSPGSALQILVSDVNGLRPVSDWLVQLDGAAVNLQDPQGTSSSNGFQFSTEIQAPVEPGEHSLTVEVPDALGNAASLSGFTFRVAGKQQLTVLGNFPNPFREETVFAFHTAQSFERLSLRIFSASGRLVRALAAEDTEDPNLFGAGYHEIAWDGKDQHGEDVAYGVYFFKLSILNGDKWLTHIGKIARVP